MTINFCTLFDYNYIERGLMLYYSLYNVCPDFKLYIISFDNKCYDSLVGKELDNIIVIKYSDFENDTLKEAKSNRNRREYLWTCSSFGIKYILEKYDLEVCTYLDSDLFFYSDPTNVIKNFINSNKDVGIISHRFSKHYENSYFERICGKYCVEFNSFKNTKEGLKVLNWWCDKCFESCPDKPTKDAFGDQKYLDYFEKMSSSIYVYEDFGLGIAPWNIDDYKYISNNKIENKKTRDRGNIIFYHFHCLNLYDNSANINVYNRPGRKYDKLVDYLYSNYLKNLNKSKKTLNKNNDLKKLSDSKRLKNVLSFIFAEKNIIFAINKFFRLLLFRKKDIYYYE